jgi:uncharacterized protein YcfL
MTKQLFTLDSLKAVVAVCCLALWAGCNAPGSPSVNPNDPHRHKIESPHLSVTKIIVSEHPSSKLLEVNIEFYNKGRDSNFSYEFYWLDERGVKVPGIDGVQREWISRGQYVFQRTAPNDRAKDFKFKIRRGS